MTTLLLIAVVLSGGPAKADKKAADGCYVYAKRCEPECKKAYQEAASPTGGCAKEVKAFNDAATKKPDPPLAFGQCIVACAPKGDMKCVGPSSAAVCDCQAACFKQYVPDALEPARAAAKCAHTLVAPACQ
jgi:hypothetical protein